ncbi:hypothetical protein BH10PSE19_BH10PSE19_18310 [soil metagenome]
MSYQWSLISEQKRVSILNPYASRLHRPTVADMPRSASLNSTDAESGVVSSLDLIAPAASSSSYFSADVDEKEAYVSLEDEDDLRSDLEGYRQRFPRMLRRDSLLQSLLLHIAFVRLSCPPSSPFISAPLLPVPPLFSNWDGVHLPEPATLNKILRVNRFMAGTSVITDKVWPTLLFALLSHEGYTLFTDPSVEHFSDRLKATFLGIANEQTAWSRHLGSSVPGDFGDYRYWIGAALLAFGPTLLGMLNALSHRALTVTLYNDELSQIREWLRATATPARFLDTVRPFLLPCNLLRQGIDRADVFMSWGLDGGRSWVAELEHIATHHYSFTRWQAMSALARIADAREKPSLNPHLQRPVLDALQRLAEPKTSLYAKYLLWTLNRSTASVPLQTAFWLYAGYQLYAGFRRVEIIAQKSMGLYEYQQAKDECNTTAQGRYVLTQAGRHECLSCDETFVSYHDQHTPQGCLDGLLSRARSPQTILELQGKLALQAGFSRIDHIDLSAQTWPSWEDVQWDAFLTPFENALPRLQLFNLSRSPLNTSSPSDGKAARLGQFFQKIPTDIIDLHNQELGPLRFKALFPNRYNVSTYTLDISGNLLGDASHLPQTVSAMPHLRTLLTEDNEMTDAGVGRLAPTLHSVTDISLAGNSLTAQGVASVLQTRSLAHVDFSRMPMPVDSMQALGPALTTLRSVRLVDCTIDEIAMQGFIPYVGNGSVSDYDLSHNPIADQALVSFITALPDGRVRLLNIGYIGMTDTGLGVAAPEIAKSGVQDLRISGNRLTAAGLRGLMPHATQLTTLIASNNKFGDEGALVITEALTSQPYALQHVDLADSGIGCTGGRALLQVMPKTGVRQLHLAGNKLTDEALSSASDLSRLTTLDLSRADLNASSLEHLTESLRAANATLTQLILNHNPMGGAGLRLAQGLIAPTPLHVAEIGDGVINIDLQRTLAATTPATPLSRIES